jgi:hypothetical protein
MPVFSYRLNLLNNNEIIYQLWLVVPQPSRNIDISCVTGAFSPVGKAGIVGTERVQRPHKSRHSADAALTALPSIIFDLATSAETRRCTTVLACGRHRSRHSRFRSAPARSPAALSTRSAAAAAGIQHSPTFLKRTRQLAPCSRVSGGDRKSPSKQNLPAVAIGPGGASR